MKDHLSVRVNCKLRCRKLLYEWPRLNIWTSRMVIEWKAIAVHDNNFACDIIFRFSKDLMWMENDSSSKFSCSTKSKSEKNDVNVQTPPSKLNDEQWLKPHCNVHLTPRFSLARIQPAMIIFKKSLFVVLIISSLLCRFFASFHPYPLFMISQLKSRFDKRKNMFFSKPKSTSQKIIGHDTKALTRDKLKANFLLFVHALTIYSQGSWKLAKFFLRKCPRDSAWDSYLPWQGTFCKVWCYLHTCFLAPSAEA
jgi:hypothetical protein